MKQTLKNLLLTCFVIVSVQNASGQHQNEDRPNRPPPPQMDEKTKAAFDDCTRISGMPARGSHERPTENQRAKFESCLKDKNINLPNKRPHDGPPPGASFSGSSSKVYKKRSNTNQ